MNKRIKLFEKQCWNNQTNHLDAEKFAELVVRECISKIENEAEQYAQPTWAFELVNDLKETFGIKK